MDVCDTIYNEWGPTAEIGSHRGTSSPGPPYTLSRAPLRRRAPFAWLARSRGADGTSLGLRRTVLRLVSGTGPALGSKLPELLFVSARELLTKETGERDLRVLLHVVPL